MLRLSRFRCPSDLQRLPMPTEGHYLAIQPLIGNGQDFAGLLPDTSDSFYGITNFMGCLGAGVGGAQNQPDPTWQYRGMITSRELRTLAEVSNADGLSNTIMYGETIGERTTVGRQVVIQVLNSWLSGGVARGRGFVPWMEESSVVTPLLGRANRSSAIGFGSTHRGGVNFAFGDGSVHLLTRDIAVLPYYEMCGAFDTQ